MQSVDTNAVRPKSCAGQVTVAGLPHPALAVWCRPGPGHTSRVVADSGRALPSEDGHAFH